MMKRSVRETIGSMKWAVAVVFGMAFLRLLVGLLGVPIELGGKLTSVTLATLVLLIGYAIWQARSRHGLVDVFLTALGITILYNLTIVMFLPLSAGFGLSSSYYLDPAHVGPDPNISGHVMAHLGAMPFQLGISFVLMGLVYGLGRAVMFFVNREPAMT